MWSPLEQPLELLLVIIGKTGEERAAHLHRSIPVQYQPLWVSEADLATLINMRDYTERVPGTQEKAGQCERERAVQHQPENHLVTRDGNLPLQHRCIGEPRTLYAARSS